MTKLGSRTKKDEQIKRTNVYGLESFSRTKEEFIHFFEGELVDKLQELEAERKELMDILWKRLAIAIPGLLILFFLFLLPDDLETYMKVILYFNIFAFTTGYLCVYYMTHTKKIESKVKAYIVPKLVTFMNPNFTYEPDNRVSEEGFNDTLIFKNKADSYTGDDLIKGFVYDESEGVKTNVAFSEFGAFNSQKKRTSKGRKIKPIGMLMFGLFFKVDFNKDFGDTVTIIKPRWLLKSKKQRKRIALYDKKSPLQEVHLEDPVFMKQFIVHSNDQINARVILQADTMQKLVDFVNYRADTLSGKPAKRRKRQFYIPYFTFRRNQIYLLLHTRRNHFTIWLHQKITIETAYDYFKDINRVLRLIDDLNLNLDLYKK